MAYEWRYREQGGLHSVKVIGSLFPALHGSVKHLQCHEVQLQPRDSLHKPAIVGKRKTHLAGNNDGFPGTKGQLRFAVFGGTTAGAVAGLQVGCFVWLVHRS